ncbi:MAG: sugar ABC transporter ATP-binding protein, partial [Tabrizicola sp.]
MQPILRLRGIAKSFPGVKALSGVELDLYPGQVTALVGENGAGKSTIVKVLTGIYQPDDGVIELDGKLVRFPTADAAAKAGVTAIHQETVLFDELSVAENIWLGHAPRTSWGLIDRKAMRIKAAELLESIGAKLSPDARLGDLGIASRHMVAIARALSIEAQVVVLDEPTAALSHKEIQELYDLVDKLRTQGKAILFISHKFDEIFRIADRYTVFRDGQFVGAGLMAEVTEGQLVQMMVGRSVDQIFPARVLRPGAPVLTVSGYSHPTEFADISFTLRQGEILGFYGLVGAGRSEVMQSLFGITRPSKGAVRIADDIRVIRSTAEAVEAGI